VFLKSFRQQDREVKRERREGNILSSTDFHCKLAFSYCADRSPYPLSFSSAFVEKKKGRKSNQHFYDQGNTPWINPPKIPRKKKANSEKRKEGKAERGEKTRRNATKRGFSSGSHQVLVLSVLSVSPFQHPRQH